jgi:hypothetical protein
MKQIAFAAASVLALALSGTSAQAATITFDTFADGTTVSSTADPRISDQYAPLGVTFQGFYSNGTTGSPIATTYAGGPEGANYQRNYLANAQSTSLIDFGPPVTLTPRFSTLSINFAGGANAISLSHNNFSLTGRTTFNAYGANNTLLQTFTINDGNGWGRRSLSVADVFRLDLVIGDNQYFGIDNLTFTPNATVPVPEAGTWVLMLVGFGMTGAGLRARRRSVTYA